MNSSRFPCGFVLLLLAVSARAANPPAPAGAPVTFPPAAYADMGFVFGNNVKISRLGWTSGQFEAFIAGLRESYAGKPRVFDSAAQALNDSISQRLQQIEQEESRAFNDSLKDPVRLEAYLKEMSQRMHLERSDSGLVYGVRGVSGSVRPQPGDTVVVTWSVHSPDMKAEIPQLNVTRISLQMAKLLPGLAEGVQMMSPGSAAMLILPPDLSYGSGEWPPGVERGTPLVYMVKLEQVIPGS